MNIQQVIWLVAAFGAGGGLVNCALSGEFVLPKMDRQSNAWTPGWIGNILIGAIAALAVWGVYGPLATYDLSISTKSDVHLTVGQLLNSLVVGISGGRILTLMAQKEAERVAKDKIAATLLELYSKVK